MSDQEALKELRVLFPDHEYITIRVGLSWFGHGKPDILARIVVTKFEWAGKTLDEAMESVRAWHKEQL